MLWLCVQLPDLPLEALAPPPDARARAVSVSRGGRETVRAADAAARAGGVRPGMTLPAALALVPGLHVQARQLGAERRVLRALAAWAGQFSAQVALAPAGLLIEAGASRMLFATLPALLARLRAGLDQRGHAARLALAPTPAAARVLARAADGSCVEDGAALARALAGLPLAALVPEVPAATVARLAGLGLRRLGELRRLPRAALRRRYGAPLADALARLYGEQAEIVVPWQPPKRWRQRVDLPAPVTDVAWLEPPLQGLYAALGDTLRTRGAQVGALALTLHHAPGVAPTRIELTRIAPTADIAHLAALLALRLERTPLPAPVEALTLRSGVLLSRAPPPAQLFPGAREVGQPDALLDRLRARLGEGAVGSLCLVPEHRPERASAPGIGTMPATPDGAARYRSGPARRPAFVLDPPRRLRVRAALPWLDGPLALLAGPERIESGWWDGQDVTRDYFIAAAPDGRRLWLYRDRQRAWFLHGFYA